MRFGYLYIEPNYINDPMNFFDILSLFKQGKGSARSHMKNLIEMAVVDGNFDLAEHDLLRKIARRNNISEDHLKKIHENPQEIKFELPVDKLEKFQQFYDLIHMMTVDNTVHIEEMKLCNLFATKFGYPREKSEEMIKSIQSNISNSQTHEETFKRVEWMLN
jgi:uncharacterized tellurite resistance protein B-like protein